VFDRNKTAATVIALIKPVNGRLLLLFEEWNLAGFLFNRIFDYPV
jgi:hypothetical protein